MKKNSIYPQAKEKGIRGFTLIEMMTTIAIMALILSVTVANIHGSDDSRNVGIAESGFVSDLHKVQTFAVNSEDFTSGVTPSSAWGITSTSSTGYSIIAYDNTVNQNPETTSTVSFPANVYFSSIQIQRPNGAGTYCPSSFNVQFSVPYGRVLTSFTGQPCGGGGTISISQEPNDILTAVLSSANGAVSKQVIVNGISGNIITP